MGYLKRRESSIFSVSISGDIYALLVSSLSDVLCWVVVIGLVSELELAILFIMAFCCSMSERSLGTALIKASAGCIGFASIFTCRWLSGLGFRFD